jgi:heme oxygenase (biliverdin-IX-beta and delta-forming)
VSLAESARVSEQRDASPGWLAVRLREATRAVHHGIDHHPLMMPLVRPDLMLPHYRHVLRTMGWIHEPLQAVVCRQLEQTGAAYRLADRVGWLKTDLAHFGLTDSMAVAPWQPPLPDSLAALTGMLYVIEGSTLGGQVIARQLAASLHLGPDNGARFFHGWGLETRQRWGDFWQFAESACTPAQGQEAATAALLLFERLHAAFDEALTWKDPSCR